MILILQACGHLMTHKTPAVQEVEPDIFLNFLARLYFGNQTSNPNALSTIWSQYFALLTALRDFVPMKELIVELLNAVSLEPSKISTIKSTVWEDNKGCCKLANLEMFQITLRSKHYTVKYHWFWTHIKPNGALILHIILQTYPPKV